MLWYRDSDRIIDLHEYRHIKPAVNGNSIGQVTYSIEFLPKSGGDLEPIIWSFGNDEADCDAVYEDICNTLMAHQDKMEAIF